MWDIAELILATYGTVWVAVVLPYAVVTNEPEVAVLAITPVLVGVAGFAFLVLGDAWVTLAKRWGAQR